MSNNLQSNPIIVTTEFIGGSYKTLAPITDFVLRIKTVIWTGASAGAVFTIIDPVSGNVLLTRTCPAANTDVVVDWTASPKQWADFGVSRIDSGTLYIILD